MCKLILVAGQKLKRRTGQVKERSSQFHKPYKISMLRVGERGGVRGRERGEREIGKGFVFYCLPIQLHPYVFIVGLTYSYGSSFNSPTSFNKLFPKPKGT